MPAKILIVDDEPNMLRLLGFALEGEGYTILASQAGEEALTKVRSEQPDLLILDVMLPGMDGIEVCRRLRQDPKTIALPIILLSAKTTVEDRIAGLEAGADEYVPKPVDPQEMVARVKALLERTERLLESHQTEKAPILSFMGARGGVGTTTVALNVASAFVNQGHRVCAVEFRPYLSHFSAQLALDSPPDMGPLLGLEPGQINQRNIRPCLVKHTTGLHVLCAATTPHAIEPIDPDAAVSLLEGLRSEMDIIVADLQDLPSPASHSVLERSFAVLLVLEPIQTCVKAAEAMLNVLKSWAAGADLIGLVVVNRSGLASSLSIPEVETYLGYKVLGAIPRAGDPLNAVEKFGKPLVHAQPENGASIALTKLAESLYGEKALA